LWQPKRRPYIIVYYFHTIYYVYAYNSYLFLFKYFIFNKDKLIVKNKKKRITLCHGRCMTMRVLGVILIFTSFFHPLRNAVLLCDDWSAVHTIIYAFPLQTVYPSNPRWFFPSVIFHRIHLIINDRLLAYMCERGTIYYVYPKRRFKNKRCGKKQPAVM